MLKTRAAAATPTTAPASGTEEGPAPKKRKVANGSAAGETSADSKGLKANAELQFYVQDTSFAIPQRKKLRLELTRGEVPYLRARNQATQDIEFGVPVEKIRELYLCGLKFC